MKDNSDLFLVLTRQWFDMIEAKIKPDEYRGITPYWIRRLVSFEKYPKEYKIQTKTFAEDVFFDCNRIEDGFEAFKVILEAYSGEFKKFKTVTFQHGYAKNADRMQFEFAGIEVAKGNTDWGAEEGVYYFVIHLGKRIDV